VNVVQVTFLCYVYNLFCYFFTSIFNVFVIISAYFYMLSSAPNTSNAERLRSLELEVNDFYCCLWIGNGLCSYRVRGVEGSCAKHLTIEFCAVVMLLTFILIIITMPSPPHSFISGLKPSSSVWGLTPRIPWTVHRYFWACPFFTC